MCLTIPLWGFLGVNYGVKWLKPTYASFESFLLNEDRCSRKRPFSLLIYFYVLKSIDHVKEDKVKHGGREGGGLSYNFEKNCVLVTMKIIKKNTPIQTKQKTKKTKKML